MGLIREEKKLTKRGKLFNEVQKRLKIFKDLQDDKTLAALASLLIDDCDYCPFVVECRAEQTDCVRAMYHLLQSRGDENANS